MKSLELLQIASDLEESECDPMVIENIVARIRLIADEIDNDEDDPDR